MVQFSDRLIEIIDSRSHLTSIGEDNGMSSQLKEKANDLALMLVMASPGDKAGLALLLDICQEVQQLASVSELSSRVSGAVEYLKSKQESDSLFDDLQSFANALTQLLEGGEVTFPNEKSDASSKHLKCADLTEDVDERFLTEYIETHTLLLEEFEASLLDYQSKREGAEEVTTAAKRYLHNLKGDSGSIGLIGIEKACHALEDELLKSGIDGLLTALLNFKQWVNNCMRSYAAGTQPEVDSKAFISSLSGVETVVNEERESATLEKTPTETVKSESKQYAITGEKEILLEFATEAEEHLNNVEAVILDSEGTYSLDSVNTIFRAVHSIKGGSSYFSIEEMTRCSHILENYLSEVRDGKRELDQSLSALLLTYIDLQKNVLNRARGAASSGNPMTHSIESINFLMSLETYGKGETISAAKLPPSAPQQSQPEPDSVSRGLAQPAAEIQESKAQGDQKLALKTFVKVDTARLDLLIDSIGEMVIYSSMLIRHCRELLHDNELVMDATHRVEKFSRDLQDIGMSMRLVPIKSLFQKMSRLVWDTSKKIGKDIVFSMSGEDTELDRNLIDKLADPLMHMVRNSLDHGIEPPEEREAKGKPRSGKIELSAYHAGGSIHIQIKDDGRGLDPAKLIAKAIEKGVIQEGQKLSDQEAHHLIFAAGFSTAAKVTDISGRGVGMDVVRRNVESLRGRIHIQSKVGQGSTFTIELPLTLAIIDGIQARVGKETFIIPSLSIIEFVRPKPEMITNTLDYGETFHFRGKFLPVYRIGDLYGIEARYNTPIDATMVIVEGNQEQVALMVDDILGEVSTVIKSLGSIFEEGQGFAGCAIMPGGSVALILDIRSLVQLARRDYKRITTQQEIDSNIALH